MKTKRIQALEDRRNAIAAKLNELDEAVIERGADLNADEQAAYEAHTAELDKVNADLAVLVKREADLAASVALTSSLGAATNGNNGRITRSDDDDAVYVERGEHDLFVDIWRSRHGDRRAAERIERHAEISDRIIRASGTSDLAGLVVPKYAVERYQELAVQRGRPYLNTLVGSMSYEPLTSNSIIIPVETTAPGMGAQSSEGTAFSTANVASTTKTVNANTVGGYADISRQALDLGNVQSGRFFGEMLTRYYNDQERQALWGSGSSGECEGLFLADGTQTVNAGYTVTGFVEHYQAVIEAASKVETNDEREAQYILMTPGRWRALQSACDADGRPLMGFNGSAPQNVGAYVDGGGQKWFAGIRVVTSSRVQKSGEDDTVMAVYNTDHALFSDAAVQTITASEVVAHQGLVRFIAFGYMAYTPEIRVNSVCLITNLGTPDFSMSAVS